MVDARGRKDTRDLSDVAWEDSSAEEVAMVSREQVKQWLGPGVQDAVNSAQGLSSKLLRVQDPELLRVGIDGESNVNDHIHALLDLLAWHHYEVAHGTKPANQVQLIIGYGPNTERSLPPLRTLRKTHTGWPKIELSVLEEEGGKLELRNPDNGEPPTFDAKAPEYAGYLTAWYGIEPAGLAEELLVSSPDSARLRLYPQLSEPPLAGEWSVRLDGLQVGKVDRTAGFLQVGGGQEGSSQKAVKVWRDLTGGKEVPFSHDSVDEAVALIHQLVERLGHASGGLLNHGVPEHALESSIVRGETTVCIGGSRLLPMGSEQSLVARGSQIPTLWSPDDKPRYLDALLHDGRVPWAVEMKVQAGGGYGAYLRHAIGQAVLYRHFLRSAPAYRPFFEDHGLDSQAVRAAVVYPQPTEDVQRKIAVRIGNLLLTAAAFDVQVATVDAGWLH